MAQSTRWCFTLNNYEPNDEARLQALRQPEVKYIVFGRETGEGGTPHLQGFVIFGRRLRLRSAKAAIGDRAHLEVTRGTSLEASQYCKKDGDYYELGTPPTERQRTDWHDLKMWVLQQPSKPSAKLVAEEHPRFFNSYGKLMEWIDLIYPAPQLVDPEDGARPWQERLGEVLAAPAHPRHVYFIVDETGGSGKSWFCEWWSAKKPDKVQILSSGKLVDLFYLIDESREYFFFDIPRSKSEHMQYAVYEKLKDRRITSTKYQGRVKVLGKCPHVVVFMNEDPDRNALSADRYKVWRLLNMNQYDEE